MLTKTNSTWIKRRILDQLPDPRAQEESKQVLLVFEKDVGVILKEVVKKQNVHEEAIHLAKAVSIV